MQNVKPGIANTFVLVELDRHGRSIGRSGHIYVTSSHQFVEMFLGELSVRMKENPLVFGGKAEFEGRPPWYR